jgi:hypothetical protein
MACGRAFPMPEERLDGIVSPRQILHSSQSRLNLIHQPIDHALVPFAPDPNDLGELVPIWSSRSASRAFER